MGKKPNLLFILVDQLRASSLPLFGENQIATPNIDRLASEGTSFTDAISTCPVCVPYRSMLLTGRHPQTTGHIVNFIKTRHDEVGFGDVYQKAGYHTGYIGKWHLHTGSFPNIGGKDYVPQGRDRLGFEYWRGYNFHMDYFDGSVNKGDWQSEHWDGYETDALNRYAFEFLDQVGDESFCLFVSPHQPHATPYQYAPDKYYEKLPEKLSLPANVPAELMEKSLREYRHYLAMILAIDDMLGEMIGYLKRTGKLDNTLIVFTSDHGSQFGAQGVGPWMKKQPYEESIKVPLIVRWPGVFPGGELCSELTSPVDFLPTLCSLCDIPIPSTVEGIDLSQAWLKREGAVRREAALTMNFNRIFDHIVEGMEWRGVRTSQYNYCRWLDGKSELFDIQGDPLQMHNLIDQSEYSEVARQLEHKLQTLLKERNDDLYPASHYKDWFDYQRRVIKNAYGELGDPESPPSPGLF